MTARDLTPTERSIRVLVAQPEGIPTDALSITADLARRLLRYEPETGKLFWLARPAAMFTSERACRSWNTRYAGREAFTSVDSQGYLQGSMFDCACRAHRVIWLLQRGEWPSKHIDHINRVRTDNRWINLREVTVSTNNRNHGLFVTNTSGVNGVAWCKRVGKWRARITLNDRDVHLGLYDTIAEATAARAAADVKYGFGKIHGEAA